MARNNRKPTRSQKSNYGQEQEANQDERTFYTPPAKLNSEPLRARNPKQDKYMKAIATQAVTFGIGPAGTGKTYIATVMACDMLTRGTIDKIIITRPAVEAGEKLGFLPGDENEKYAPYIAPFREIMNERIGKSRVDYLIKTGAIKAEPFAYMRGKTFKNAFVILDEAQNTTKVQLKLLLTRIGENCRVIVDGDIDQTDISNSGLQDAVDRLSYIPTVSVVEFNVSEVVRSGICGEIVQAYSQDIPRR
jgi:phosphate starvation-inducible PhoH-like protein